MSVYRDFLGALRFYVYFLDEGKLISSEVVVCLVARLIQSHDPSTILTRLGMVRVWEEKERPSVAHYIQIFRLRSSFQGYWQFANLA